MRETETTKVLEPRQVDSYFQIRLKYDQDTSPGSTGFVVIELKNSTTGKKLTEFYQSITMPNQPSGKEVDVFEELVAPVPKGHRVEIVSSYGVNPAVVKFIFLPSST